VALKAGEHTLEIETLKDDPSEAVYFYAMHLGNLEDFYGGPTAANMLGAGAATGQTQGRYQLITALCTAMAQLWGLVPYAYEGGTNAGGDWNGGQLYYPSQFKFEHPMSKVADNQWARTWHNFGGANAFYHYVGFPRAEIHRAEEFMPWAAAIGRAHEFQWEPEGPVAAPVTFRPAEQKHYQGKQASTYSGWAHPWSSESHWERTVDGGRLAAGQWKGFRFRVPKAGEYTVAARTTPGGAAVLVLNDTQARVEAPTGGALAVKAWLNKGVHAIRLQSLQGAFELKSLVVE
jgi:hypothetical protein